MHHTLLVFLLAPQSRVPNPVVSVDQLCLNVVSPSLPGTDIVCNATCWFIPAFSLHTAVLFSLQSLCLMHTWKPAGGAVSHCRTWFSDSANPHYVSDPLPQLFVGSSWHQTALNLDSETLSRVPYDEQGTPAHLGLDQKTKKH